MAPHSASNPQLEEERVVFDNSAGEKLVGILRRSSSNQAVVLCHGFVSGKDRGLGDGYPVFATELAELGLNTLRFDFSGNGESEGEFEYANYKKEVGDLRSAVEYLRYLGLEVLCVVGHSKGGNVVVLYAAKYDDTPLVINYCGRFHMLTGIKERFGDDIFERLEREGSIQMLEPLQNFTWKLTKESMDERVQTDMAAAAAAIKRSKVLTVHGSEDRTIPVEDGVKFGELIAGSKLHIVEGGDHRFKASPNIAAEALSVGLEFFKDHLKGH